MRDTEDSAELDHCTRQSNMNYDKCFYGRYHQLFMSKFNCTFSFFIGNYKSSNNSEYSSPSKLGECRLSDFSEKDVEFFRSLNEGEIFD